MPLHQQNTVTPLRGGPLHGTPAGFQYWAIPCSAETFIEADATQIDLLLPILIQWWGRLLDQQSFTFIADRTCTGVTVVYLAGQGPYQLYLSGSPSAGSDIHAGDFIQMAWDEALGAFQGVNWTTVGTGGGTTGTEVIETGAGPFVVADNESALILNKAIASATAITLGPVADRSGLDWVVSDVGNNAGDIVITPAPGETIMGFATYTIGSGGAATFKPNATLNGWFMS